MKIYRFLILLFIMLFPGMVLAQDTIRGDSLTRQNGLVEDDPVSAMLDSLANMTIFRNPSFMSPIQTHDFSISSDPNVPYFPDSIYRERITNMSIQSPFEYVYNNEVRKFIDLYAYKKRGLTERILGLAQVYFPLFEEKLDKMNMPLELKYLAVIESALNPVANSRAGAKGLWQFMYGTGKVYGLKITSYVDDRFDPIKSTIAACEHLNDLYNIYGNWSLALAAYNSGAGNVNKAIRRAGGAKNFWVIQRYLPRETRAYVPAFIAASYVLTYSKEHHIYPVDPGILFYEIDTVIVKNPLTFDQLTEMLNISREDLQFLNPAYKQGVIPATPDNHYVLRLRKKNVADFINNEAALCAYKTRKGIERDSLLALVYMNNRETMEYRVKKGETLSSIARKFHMSASDLKGLNCLQKNYVRPKQRLLVYIGPPKGKAPGKTIRRESLSTDSSTHTIVENKTVGSSSPVPTIHVVKSGETLNKISQKYSCSVSDLTKWNNLKGTDIAVGQKLKVVAPAGAETATVQNEPKQTKSQNTKSIAGSKKSSSIQKYIWHTVKSGDNLWDIAQQYDGVTVADIKKLNKFTSSHRLIPGQKIKIKPTN